MKNTDITNKTSEVYINMDTAENKESMENDKKIESNNDKNQECEVKCENPNIETLKEYGQMSLPKVPQNNPRGNIQFIPLIGQIEGHTQLPPQNKTTKYEHIIPQLVMAADNPEVDGLLVLLNTVGGDVETGLAIAELISNLGKPSVSLVIGGGHSIGVPLAVSANFSFIANSATMTIHPVRMNGTVVGAPQTYDYFNKMQDRVLDFIVGNSKISNSKLKTLMMDTNNMAMDMGTILIGKEAVNAKLIDKVGGIHDALEKLYDLINESRKLKMKKEK